MHETSRKITLSFIVLLMLAFTQIARAQSLVLIIETEEHYNLGQEIIINGNLTQNGSPVSDGLVSIQVSDPKGNTLIIRTVPTGTGPTGSTIEILEAFPCDANGYPISSISLGGDVGFKFTIRNNGASSQHVLLTLNIHYSNKVPFKLLVLYNESINGGDQITKMSYPRFRIPYNAPLGPASTYTSALKTWPNSSGFAYGPEKSAVFTITGGGASSAAIRTNLETQIASAAGTFNTSFRTPGQGGLLGNYTVYATSLYELSFAGDQEIFRVVLVSDLTGPYGVPDGKVDMRDIYLVARAFGSEPGHPRWDPRADLTGPEDVPDGKVDMRDVYLVARDFGKQGEDP